MYVWFVVLLSLGSLTAGYFFRSGQVLGDISINKAGEWWWRRRSDRAKRRYAEPCEPSFEVELEPVPTNGDQETTEMEPVE